MNRIHQLARLAGCTRRMYYSVLGIFFLSRNVKYNKFGRLSIFCLCVCFILFRSGKLHVLYIWKFVIL